MYSVYDGSVSNFIETTDGWQGFIYDGWTVVEVFDVSLVVPAVKTQYSWGLDMSGSLQGAGGIGGLLAARELQGTTTTADDKDYWFFYDPYGNTLTLAGPYATANPFRFSTKWLDDETATASPGGAIGTTES